MALRHNPEERLQIACVRWMQHQWPKYAPCLQHLANGGYRTKAEAAIFKAMGVRPGYPDLFLFVARGPYHGLAIELKAGANKQTPAQVECQDRLRDNGYQYVVIRTVEDFKALINNYFTEWTPLKLL